MELIVPYLSLGISLLAIGISYHCFQVAQQRSVRPVLVFTHEGHKSGGESLWEIENAGTGPAVNVLVASGDINFKWNTQTAVLFPTFAAGSKRRLNWIPHPSSLVAIYTDCEGRAFTTTCARSRNCFRSKNLYPTLKPAMQAYQIGHD